MSKDEFYYIRYCFADGHSLEALKDITWLAIALWTPAYDFSGMRIRPDPACDRRGIASTNWGCLCDKKGQYGPKTSDTTLQISDRRSGQKGKQWILDTHTYIGYEYTMSEPERFTLFFNPDFHKLGTRDTIVSPEVEETVGQTHSSGPSGPGSPEGAVSSDSDEGLVMGGSRSTLKGPAPRSTNTRLVINNGTTEPALGKRVEGPEPQQPIKVIEETPPNLVREVGGIKYSLVTIMAHELGHAMGLMHEHQRVDRDRYLNMEPSLFPKKTREDAEASFEENPNEYEGLDTNGKLRKALANYDLAEQDWPEVGGWAIDNSRTSPKGKVHDAEGFDYGSIMMYSSADTVEETVNSAADLVPAKCAMTRKMLDGTSGVVWQGGVAQEGRISARDIRRIAQMYPPPPPKEATNPNAPAQPKAKDARESSQLTPSAGRVSAKQSELGKDTKRDHIRGPPEQCRPREERTGSVLGHAEQLTANENAPSGFKVKKESKQSVAETGSEAASPESWNKTSAPQHISLSTGSVRSKRGFSVVNEAAYEEAIKVPRYRTHGPWPITDEKNKLHIVRYCFQDESSAKTLLEFLMKGIALWQPAYEYTAVRILPDPICGKPDNVKSWKCMCNDKDKNPYDENQPTAARNTLRIFDGRGDNPFAWNSQNSAYRGYDYTLADPEAFHLTFGRINQWGGQELGEDSENESSGNESPGNESPGNESSGNEGSPRPSEGSSGSRVRENNKNELIGSMAHELGHVMGLQHEHQRPDRDRYVHWDPTKLPAYNSLKAKVEHAQINSPGATLEQKVLAVSGSSLIASEGEGPSVAVKRFPEVKSYMKLDDKQSNQEFTCDRDEFDYGSIMIYSSALGVAQTAEVNPNTAPLTRKMPDGSRALLRSGGSVVLDDGSTTPERISLYDIKQLAKLYPGTREQQSQLQALQQWQARSVRVPTYEKVKVGKKWKKVLKWVQWNLEPNAPDVVGPDLQLIGRSKGKGVLRVGAETAEAQTAAGRAYEGQALASPGKLTYSQQRASRKGGSGHGSSRETRAS